MAAELDSAWGGEVFAASLAHGEDGAMQTQGRAGEADGCAQLHHGLVVIAGSIVAFGPTVSGRASGDEGCGFFLDVGSAFGGF